MRKIRRGTFKHIESELYHYHETKKELEALRRDILLSSPDRDCASPARSTGLPSDPTGQTATLLMTHRRIEQMGKIVEAIEHVYNTVPDGWKKLIRLKYWTKPQTLTWEGIAQQLHVSARQAMRWRDDIVHAIAEHLGWQ